MADTGEEIRILNTAVSEEKRTFNAFLQSHSAERGFGEVF